MNLLNRIFRTYKDEQEGRPISEHRKRMLQVDEGYAMTLQMRDNNTEARKDKRLVNVVRVDPKTGKTVRYSAGVFATRDKGSVESKLRVAFGGKAARRILNEERRAGRNDPEALAVVSRDEGGEAHTLTRGVDFALIPKSFGGPKLVLHDAVTDFDVSYTTGFAASVAEDEDFALDC